MELREFRAFLRTPWEPTPGHLVLPGLHTQSRSNDSRGYSVWKLQWEGSSVPCECNNNRIAWPPSSYPHVQLSSVLPTYGLTGPGQARP